MIELNKIVLTKHNKFLMGSEEVNIHIPLPQKTCMNWNESYNYQHNVGIIYKGNQITLEQLSFIKRVYHCDPESRSITPYMSAKAFFDGKEVTAKDINEINRIMYSIEERLPFKRETNIIL